MKKPAITSAHANWLKRSDAAGVPAYKLWSSTILGTASTASRTTRGTISEKMADASAHSSPGIIRYL